MNEDVFVSRLLTKDEPLRNIKIERYPKGEKRIESILKASQRILINGGYAGLTMRNVAKQAGTTVGNVQHFFANKSNLLHELLEYSVREFFVGFDLIASDPDKTGEEKLAAYVNSIFDAFPTVEKSKFFPEFWALSNHNKNAATFLAEMYEQGLVPLTKIIAEINPNLKKRRFREVALVIVGCVEGLVIFVGYRRPWESSFKAVRKIALGACIHIAKTAK